MLGQLIKGGAKTLGSQIAKHPWQTAGLAGVGGLEAWQGVGADEEEFNKAMEQLHSEGLIMNEDGSGGPIDPKDMMEFWQKNSWHSQHKAQHWGGRAASLALGFVPWAGIPLSLGADYIMDKQVDNSSLIENIRRQAIESKNQPLNEKLNQEQNNDGQTET